MSTYFVAYLQVKKGNAWESVGPFTKEGELNPFYETAGLIRDLFSDYHEHNFNAYRRLDKEDFTLDNFSPEILDMFNEWLEDILYNNGFIKFTSLAALHQYVLIHPTIVDYDSKDGWEDDKPAPCIDNPVKDVFNRAMDLLDMMGYYISSALDEEDVRIVYYLG